MYTVSYKELHRGCYIALQVIQYPVARVHFVDKGNFIDPVRTGGMLVYQGTAIVNICIHIVIYRLVTQVNCRSVLREENVVPIRFAVLPFVYEDMAVNRILKVVRTILVVERITLFRVVDLDISIRLWCIASVTRKQDRCEQKNDHLMLHPPHFL